MESPGSPSRDVLLAGMHGDRLGWVRDLLFGAMEQCHGSVLQVPIVGAAHDDIVCSRLIFGDFISEDWAERVRSGDLPAVLVIDDIPRACAYLLQAGLTDIEVIRTLVGVAISLGDLRGRGRTLTVPIGAWSEEVAARILGHVGLPSIIPAMGAPVTDAEPAIPDSLRTLIDVVVTPAFQFALSGVRHPVVWPRESLFWGDRPGEPAPRVLEMTGPARVLAYGPYYALPSGRWTVRVTLAFSPSSLGTPLALEMHGTTRLGRFEFVAERPGVFAASFPVVVPSARDPLEVRLCTERGAIEGVLGLDRIELIPDSDQSVA